MVTGADIDLDGHAIEVRLYAEDPITRLPSPGTITRLKLPTEVPGEVRLEHALHEGAVVTPYYDPMLCKVIVRAGDRAACVARAKQVLGQIEVSGIATNLAVNQAILSDPRFAAGDFTTDFFEQGVLAELAAAR
jgi:acetyl/propionyl-CoA carboxylase alpha subunit